MTRYTVHSNKKHKPQYWVTEGGFFGKTVFESNDASTAIQWAIDNSLDSISMDGSFDMTTGSNLKGREKPRK